MGFVSLEMPAEKASACYEPGGNTLFSILASHTCTATLYCTRVSMLYEVVCFTILLR